MMKKLLLLALLSSANLSPYAQTVTIPTFDRQNSPFRRQFYFALDRNDKMRLEVTGLEDLASLPNVDSIVTVFLADIQLLGDSLPAQIYARTVEYWIDEENLRRMSFSKRGSSRSNFVISDGEPSQLKLEQDSIYISGMVPGQVSKSIFNKDGTPHYYRLSFFLDNLESLGGYKNSFSEKLVRLRNNLNDRWTLGRDGLLHLRDNVDIYANKRRGSASGGSFVSLRPTIDVQNYRDRFVPSATGGLAHITEKNLVHQEWALGYETHFLFERDAEGRQRTYRNTFLYLSYGRSSINPETKKANALFPFISLAYLVRRRSETYNRHTFRLAMGQFALFGNYTKIEPAFYFDHFFKGLSPSLRLTQHF